MKNLSESQVKAFKKQVSQIKKLKLSQKKKKTDFNHCFEYKINENKESK